MSPRARIYTLVGAIAAAAAGVVVAVTALTADHPPGPLGPGQAAVRGGLDGAGARSPAEVRAAVGVGPAAPQPRERGTRARRSCGSTSGWRSSGGARTTLRRSRRGGRRSGSSRTRRPAVRAGDLLHPDSPRGLPQFEPSTARADTPVRRLIVRGVRLQASGRPAVGGAALRACGQAGAGRSRRPGRGRRRPLRQGRSLPRVRPPRPARAPLSACADGSLPPRIALDLARRVRPGPERTAPRPCGKREIHLWKGSAATVKAS